MSRKIFKFKRSTFHIIDICISFCALYILHSILLLKGSKHIYYRGYTGIYMRTYMRRLRVRAEQETGMQFGNGAKKFAPITLSRCIYEIEDIIGTTKYWELLETFNT